MSETTHFDAVYEKITKMSCKNVSKLVAGILNSSISSIASFLVQVEKQGVENAFKGVEFDDSIAKEMSSAVISGKMMFKLMEKFLKEKNPVMYETVESEYGEMLPEILEYINKPSKMQEAAKIIKEHVEKKTSIESKKSKDVTVDEKKLLIDLVIDEWMKRKIKKGKIR